MLSKPIGTRIVGLSETGLLEVWESNLLSTRKWGPEVHKELLETEFRVAAFFGDESNVIGFASIWPNGDPIDELNGHLWFDHLVNIRTPVGPKVSVQPTLYEQQIAYVRTQDVSRRILRTPYDPRVVELSEAKGWVQVRPPSAKAPNGVYELPRSALT